MSWLQIPDREAVREAVVNTTSAIREYARSNPREASIGVGAASAGLLLWYYGPDLRHRFFAWVNNQFVSLKNDDYDNFKRPVFEAAFKNLQSQDPKLREQNALRILEIGAGTGANFSFYPDNTRLVVADPNPYFEKYFEANKARFPNVKLETIIVVKGEDIDMVPSESVDAVVVTLVFCSVDDVEKVIRQTKRVLVPGGKFIFIEHIQEWDKKRWRRRLFQNILTWSGLWPFTFDGCHLNRDPRPAIELAGFSEVAAKREYAPMPVPFMIASPHVLGVATK